MNNFKTWIDDAEVAPGTNVQSAETFESDSQRESGFEAGTASSAIRVNTALRQANLVAAALMGVVDDENLDLTSSVDDVQQAIEDHLSGLSVAKIQDVDLSDNSVSQFGDYIIPKKKIIRSGLTNVYKTSEGVTGSSVSITFENFDITLEDGKWYEFIGAWGSENNTSLASINTRFTCKVKTSGGIRYQDMIAVYGSFYNSASSATNYSNYPVQVTLMKTGGGTNLSFELCDKQFIGDRNIIYITDIYEIVE